MSTRWIVRKPGHGDAVQKSFERYTRAKISIASKGNSIPNGGEKREVSR